MQQQQVQNTPIMMMGPNGQSFYIVGQEQQPQLVVPQQQQPQVAGQQQQQQPQVIFITDPRNTSGFHRQLGNYKISLVRAAAITQIIMAVLCIAFNIGAAFINYNYGWAIAAGWWASPFFAMAGAFGLTSTYYRTFCWVNTTLAFCIISCVVDIGVVVQAGIGLTDSCWRRCPGRSENLGVMSCLLIFALVEFAAALTGSILCCQATCRACQDPSVQPLQANSAQNVYFNAGMVQSDLSHFQQQQPQQFMASAMPPPGAEAADHDPPAYEANEKYGIPE